MKISRRSLLASVALFALTPTLSFTSTPEAVDRLWNLISKQNTKDVFFRWSCTKQPGCYDSLYLDMNVDGWYDPSIIHTVRQNAATFSPDDVEVIANNFEVITERLTKAKIPYKVEGLALKV